MGRGSIGELRGRLVGKPTVKDVTNNGFPGLVFGTTAEYLVRLH